MKNSLLDLKGTSGKTWSLKPRMLYWIYTMVKQTHFGLQLHCMVANGNRCLQASLLTLNFNKTNLIQFTSKNIETAQAHIKYRGNYIQNTSTNKITFLGLIVDKTLSWQSHLDKLSSKLSSASYTIRTLKPIN